MYNFLGCEGRVGQGLKHGWVHKCVEHGCVWIVISWQYQVLVKYG